MIGKLRRVPLREVWKHEALDFTYWLQQNYDVLNEVLDLTLTNVELEQAAGAFRVDLVAEDQSGHPVIIENQLEKSDHDHLGKLITYLTAFDAKAAIWIVSDPRPEHITAITWLNEATSASFYLIKVEAVRIDSSSLNGKSPAAPLFTLIIGPSETTKEVGEKKKELAEREIVRQRFWTELLERAKARTSLHGNVSASTDFWIGAGAGRSGLSYIYSIRQHDARVELYINQGDAESNRVLFEALEAHKNPIDAAFGETLEWKPLKTSYRISKTIDLGGYLDENWSATQDAMIDAMHRLEKALQPYIARLPK
ncbi:DUF4268 domain-containing protein [Nitrolancea hollandica]|uniref:DUF4268 domain-containing protein n=1 Tax=Nitrolancea hollandica Lb TaxID=1129897 RepID=I4EC91_9BACT|nr:DUF4268 domain-containing protein [Nitrolancea hollandica]CCF82303.1 conserved hypothetical protein [Nitrolancea hollandica Lb]